MSRFSEARAGSLRPVLLLALCALALGSCYSSDYERQVRANVSLLSDLSQKLADYCRAGFSLNGQPLSSEEMGEFYYAGKKASSFASMIRSGASNRASFREFEKLLRAYNQFVSEADQSRLEAPEKRIALQELLAEADSVKVQAQAVLDALDAERARKKSDLARPRLTPPIEHRDLVHRFAFHWSELVDRISNWQQGIRLHAAGEVQCRMHFVLEKRVDRR